MKIVPIIMSGGSGTRLWPISTPSAPKQFHALATEKTMIQETVLRLKGDQFLAPIIICGESHLENVQTQMAQIGITPSRIILEPCPRNTAAVGAVAAIVAAEFGPETLALLLPADHIVTKPVAFKSAIIAAIETAESRIVTFGIAPDKPETGYGYIEQGEVMSSENGHEIFTIKRFCEKPDFATASEYVAGGKHFWNGGIFLFSPDVMIEELRKFAPEVLEYSEFALKNADFANKILRLRQKDFEKVPSISVDYAIMEKTENSAVIPCDIGWADVGSFSEIWRLGAKDENGNHGPNNAIHIDSKNNLIIANDLPVSIIGLEDIMVVVSNAGILVAPKSRSQDVKIACEMAKSIK